ncbi:unknown [[Mannheimia] succiniciproducens MBEL55E]|uniref:Uncharacterized protein n=1 Tax=Mannheimia succiniciproducens (strain KCTC 0769BP / MBEL55E) TaxID=221988 RepID=Q65U25_MANSM|nr:unknown [[Mannheimia] succiniciproducens MBEL55E]
MAILGTTRRDELIFRRLCVENRLFIFYKQTLYSIFLNYLPNVDFS